MPSNNLLLSVIIPNYNHAAYLRQRIESVLGQDYENIELILLDDFSQDNSCDILDEFSVHPKVKHVVKNQTNSGSTFLQWQRGFELAKGDLIWIAESDDRSDHRFASELIHMIEDKQLDLAYCDSHVINQDGDIEGRLDWWYASLSHDQWKQSFVMDGSTFVRDYMSIKNAIMNASSVIFRKSALQGIAAPRADMKLCGDWDFWSRLLLGKKLGYSSAPLNYYRFHADTVRARPNNAELVYRESLQVRLMNLLSQSAPRYIIDRSAIEIIRNLKHFCLPKGRLIGALIMMKEIMIIGRTHFNLSTRMLLLIAHNVK